MSRESILFVGPLPPPVHGFSEINHRMLARMKSTSSVQIFDLSPNRGGVIHYLRLLSKFIYSAIRARCGALYLPLSGGLRQLGDITFAGIALLFGLRVYVHHHSFAYINNRPFYTNFVLGLLKNSVHIVLCERMGELLTRQYFIPTKNIRLISNVAFLDDFNKSNKFSKQNKKLVLGFLSNITATKGCFEFIDLVQASNENGMEVEALMAGPVESTIKKDFDLAVNNVPFIKYLGAVYGEEKRNFFDKIDILVFPTKYENEAEPVTIWEALGVGVPIISLSRGCIDSVVINGIGWVMQNPQYFAVEALEKIRYIHSNILILTTMKKSAYEHFVNAKNIHTKNLDKLILEIAGKN